jgi:hypothetical protein
MRIGETLDKIKELQHLTGTKIPGTNDIIDDIIPAPENNQLNDFIEIYLKTESLATAIQTFNVKDFEILILSNSKKKDMFDIKTSFSYAWYKDYF